MSATKNFSAAAAAAIAVTTVVAAVGGAKTLRGPDMCVEQPSDGGVCWLVGPDFRAPVARGAAVPVEGTEGQCSQPKPCPRPK